MKLTRRSVSTQTGGETSFDKAEAFESVVAKALAANKCAEACDGACPDCPVKAMAKELHGENLTGDQIRERMRGPKAYADKDQRDPREQPDKRENETSDPSVEHDDHPDQEMDSRITQDDSYEPPATFRQTFEPFQPVTSLVDASAMYGQPEISPAQADSVVMESALKQEPQAVTVPTERPVINEAQASQQQAAPEPATAWEMTRNPALLQDAAPVPQPQANQSALRTQDPSSPVPAAPAAREQAQSSAQQQSSVALSSPHPEAATQPNAHSVQELQRQNEALRSALLHERAAFIEKLGEHRSQKMQSPGERGGISAAVAKALSDRSVIHATQEGDSRHQSRRRYEGAQSRDLETGRRQGPIRRNDTHQSRGPRPERPQAGPRTGAALGLTEAGLSRAITKSLTSSIQTAIEAAVRAEVRSAIARLEASRLDRILTRSSPDTQGQIRRVTRVTTSGIQPQDVRYGGLERTRSLRDSPQIQSSHRSEERQILRPRNGVTREDSRVAVATLRRDAPPQLLTARDNLSAATGAALTRRANLLETLRDLRRSLGALQPETQVRQDSKLSQALARQPSQRGAQEVTASPNMSRSLLTLQTLLSAHLNALRQSVLAVRAPLRINAYEQLLRRISLFVAEQHAIDRQISKYAMDELIELLAEGERLLAGTDPSTAHKRSRSLTLESRGRKSRRSAPAAFAGIEEIQQRNRKQHQGSGAPEILSKAKAGSATKSGAKSVRDARNAPSMSLDITMSKEDDSPSEEAAFQP